MFYLRFRDVAIAAAQASEIIEIRLRQVQALLKVRVEQRPDETREEMLARILRGDIGRVNVVDVQEVGL